MDITVKPFNDAFNFKADNYEVLLNPDFNNYGNGYINISKCYPTNIVQEYLKVLGSDSDEYPSWFDGWKEYIVSNPRRFWFANKYTLVEDLSGIIYNTFDFGNAGNVYHIISIDVVLQKYSIKAKSYEGKVFYRLLITKMVVEHD